MLSWLLASLCISIDLKSRKKYSFQILVVLWLSKIHFLFFLTLLQNQNKYWYSCHSVLNPVWLTVQWCSVHIVECICGPTMMTASPRFIFMKRKALNNWENNFWRSIPFVCLFVWSRFHEDRLGACCHHCRATNVLDNVYTTPLHI